MTTETLCKCHAPNCGAVFPMPATGVCPECNETYIKRHDPTQETLRDLLAEVDNVIATNERVAARLAKVQAALWRLVQS